MLCHSRWPAAAFAEENPSAGAQEWQDAFGSPEALAKELLAECDPGALAQARRRRSWMVRGGLALLAILLTVAVSLVVYFYYWNTRGHYSVTTKVYVTARATSQPESNEDFVVTYHYD